MNLVSAFASSAHKHKQKIALFWGEREYSYQELWSQTRVISRRLKNHFAVNPGDRVGLWLKNCPEFVPAFFGILETGTAVVPSTVENPQTDAQLKLMGAGLGREVKISPLHAAAMMGAVANRGVMMAPIMADRITNSLGEAVFVAKPQQLRRIVSEETADQLARLLSSTVRTGTSRKAFHDRRGRPMLREVTVAAKTGSIDGKDPAGHYSWFAAYAPMDDPKIALVALVVNQGKWNIKASNVGEKALEAFFR